MVPTLSSPSPRSRPRRAATAFSFFAGAAFALVALFASLAPLRGAAPATPPFRIGLNGAFIGNSTLTTAQQLALFKEVGAAGLRHLEPNDVYWATVQQTNGLFTFTNTDGVMASSAGSGLGFLPTFYGSDVQNYYVPPGTATTNAWSAAAYGTQTTTYLSTVVNRYKSVAHYWEIANEMNTKTTPPAGFSAADYAAFLIYNRNAIRAADPTAQVVIAGTLGNYGYPFANAYQWMRDVLAAGGGAGFDVFNFHDYKSWWTLPTHYDQFRAILDANNLRDVPIWVTETAQASAIVNANINPAYASPDGQAADVWRRFAVLFGKGAQTVFWHSFWNNPNDTSGFRNMGLMSSTNSQRNKAWHAFKLLTGKLEGFSTATLVSTGVTNDDNVTGGTGVWIVRFDFSDGTKRWVAWSTDNQSTTLTGLAATGAATTVVVPATIAGDGATVTWTTATPAITGGSLTLALTASPTLIELVNVTPVVSAPTIATAPAAATVTTGGAATFTVVASGTAPFTYQWLKNGVVISGATAATYTIAAAQAADAGNYSCIVSNSAGPTASAAAALTVTPVTPPASAGPTAWLTNLSVRTTLASAQTLLVGFTLNAGTKDILVRAAGPALTSFGVTTAMADPKLELYRGAAKIDENDNWTAALAPTFTSLGAFSFSPGSKDAALLRALTGATSALITGTGAGVVLVEGYDAGAGNAVRLTNLSARNRVGTGENILIAGFFVTGTGTQRLLIRAAGPALAGFGVGGFLADPKLEIFDASAAKLAENDNWEATLAATATSVGAFPFTTSSRDSALIITLTAGKSYTAQVSGIAGGTGEALVEIYELP
ncbi:MAG: hypothetical protein RLZZ15_3579 [Verrucomicrobiota bacterium]|jgi:hypothetical protein